MIDIGLGHYLTLSGVIFTIGIAGIFLNRKNIIVILMSIELILLAVNINFVSFSIFLNDLVGLLRVTFGFSRLTIFKYLLFSPSILSKYLFLVLIRLDNF